MKRSLKIALALLLISFAPMSGAYADRFSSDSQSTEGEDGLDKPKEQVVSFNEFRDGFRRICTYVGQDGRQEALYNVLRVHEAKDPNCGACRPLFTLFSTVCKPTKIVKAPPRPAARAVKAEADQSPAPTPTPSIAYPQREPNIRVIESISIVFSSLAARNFGREATVKALRKFFAVLRKAEGCTPGERDYLSSLAEFMESPMRELLDEYPDERSAVQVGDL